MKLIDLSDDDVIPSNTMSEQLDGIVSPTSNEALLAQVSNDNVEEDLSNSDSESIESSPVVQAQVLRNRANRDVFNTFLQHQIDGDAASESFDRTLTSKTLENSEPIIDNPRDYQTELFQRALTSNIIAVLDTGSGKTLIAALLMREVSKKELEDRAMGKQPKMSFFLVNSVHLVLQQQRMLANNLPDSPKGLYGGVKVDLWKQVEWDKLKSENRAIVCTAEVLNQCLMRSFVKMEEINLLIFDEAHHTKKGHPYARIIKDYYLAQTNLTLRPKIFGMTASPVDTITDINIAAQTLETLLDSHIVTTQSMSLQEHSPRPTEETWEYDKPPRSSETDLFRQLKPIREVIGVDLNASFIWASEATAALGKWCSDRVWHYDLSESEVHKILGRYEKSKAYRSLETAGERAGAVDVIRQASAVTRNHQFQDLSATTDCLSPKVLLLHQKLSQQYTNNEKTRCIIFVNQRRTTRILADVFAILRIPNLVPGILVGVSGDTFGGQTETWKQHERTMDEFRSGIINCVFATSVAEEGLDIPECNLVIRFDLSKTLIQHMQSRGRARLKDSVFAHMAQRNDLNHRALIDFVTESEEYLKDSFKKLSQDRLLGQKKMTLERILLKEKPKRCFITEPTGARCDYDNCLLILSRYGSSLRHKLSKDKVFFEVHYLMDQKELTKTGKEKSVTFTAKAVIPEYDGFDGAWGEECPNKMLAKRSAAWETCVALRKKELLDGNLDSVHQKERPENANAHLAINNMLDEYDMKIKPDFWTVDVGSTPDHLFATVIHFLPSRPLNNVRRPLILFTRRRLPNLPSFPVYLEVDNETTVQFHHILDAVKIDGELAEMLTSFTLTVYCDIFYKIYERNPQQMCYWLAPCRESRQVREPGISALINTDLLKEIHNSSGKRRGWVPGMSPDLWLDRLLVDPWTGQFRYFSKRIVPNQNKDSPVPSAAKSKLGRGRMQNVLEYTLSSFPKGRPKFLQNADKNQPIFEAELIHLRRNVLDKMNEEEKTFSAYAHVAPEPLEISLLETGTARSGLIFPAIMSRLDSYLIALEAFEKLDLNVPADLALEAFTKDSDNSDEYKEQQIHFQRGMGKNYERLEFIGDSLLKMTTTIMVYIKYPTSNEFGFHTRRMMMLSNSNLFNVATGESLDLPQYVRSRTFNRRTWYPEGMILRTGKGAGPNPVRHGVGKHAIGKKTVADVSEAIIGASLLAMRQEKNKFDLGIRAISKLVKSEDHQIDTWNDFAKLYNADSPEWPRDVEDPVAKDLAARVKQRLGYSFRYPRLLRSAFTHPSDQHTPVPDYQRLEFLGDAVLDMVCINWLFNKFEDRNPQWLTEHKMAMVSNKFLAAVAVVLGFDKFISATTTKLLIDISKYAQKVRSVMETEGGDLRRDFWTEFDDPPKSLSDLVEAYLGAVIVDSDFNYGEAESFFEQHILWFFEDMEIYDGFAHKHPTTFLHKRLTEYGCMNYKLMCSDAPEGPVAVRITAGVVVHEQVVATAESSGVRYAKVRASQKCLRILESMSVAEFRQKFRCDCRDVD